MSDVIWISTAMGHPSNMRPLKHDLGETGRRDDGIDWGIRNCAGDPLRPEFFPQEIWGVSSAEEKDYKLPNIFRAGEFWVVSAAAASVLRQFNLGHGALHPVKVFQKDRETPIGDGWYCINFGNRKRAFLPEATARARQSYIRNGEKGWYPRLPYKDDDFTLSVSALSGPDFWVDPDVGDAFFLSNSLAIALITAKADKGFFLGRCKVL
jgi:hypothetical protein